MAKKKAKKSTKKKVTKRATKKATRKTTKKNKGGRPLAITKEMEIEIIELMSDGMSQAKTAISMGIDEGTLIKHKKRFVKFNKRIEKARKVTDRLAHKSLKAGMVKDWRAGAWWLERRHADEFREKKEIDLKEQPILIDDIMD